MDDTEYAQDCKNKVKKADNAVIITILNAELVKRKCYSRAPQLSLPFRKAMKAITKLNIVIDNEYKARAVPQIGPDLVQVIKRGLQSTGLYRRPQQSQIHDTRTVHRAVQSNHVEEAMRRRKRRSPISKAYIPRAGSATRAMFIVLGLAKDQNEGGLTKETVIQRARNYTNVDMNAKHDYFGVYDGFKGMTTLIEKECAVKKKRLFYITKHGYTVFNQHCRPNAPNQANHHNQDDQKVQCEQRYQEALRLSRLTAHSNNNSTNNRRYSDDDIGFISSNDMQLQRVLLLSKEENDLQRALRESKKHNSPTTSSQTSIDKNSFPYVCTICVPQKKYKTRARYRKHMKLHGMEGNESSDDDIVIETKPAKAQRISKKRTCNDLDDIKEELGSPHVKKRKIMRIENAFSDLDKVRVPDDWKTNDNFLFFDGKQYEMVLFIDTMEQNVKNLSSNYFDVLDWIRNKGVSCRYKKLLHGDYVIVLDPIDSVDSVLMIDFVVERKRYDDLRVSVCVDGRGKSQKEKLKSTPLTRKCYIVEGNERMIRKEEKKVKCRMFLNETEFEDGYNVKYTQSKHESMNLICVYYQKLLYEFKMQRGARHVIPNYTFADFQKTNQAQESNGAHKKELAQLKEMGFVDEDKNIMAISESKGNVQMAADILLSL